MQQNVTAAGGTPPGPCWGSLQHSPRPLAGFKGTASRRGGGGGREERGREGKGKGGGMQGGKVKGGRRG